MTKILTKSQKNVFNDFLDFIASPDQVMIINGQAGTGKTTILKEIIKILAQNNIKTENPSSC